MKIGVAAKSYSDIIYFDLTEVSDKQGFLTTLIKTIKTGGEDEVDLIIKPIKKENKTETGTTEE